MKRQRGPFDRLLAAWVRTMRGDETQQAFEALTQIPQSTISALKRGTRQVLPEHVDAILAATDTSLASMLKLIAELGKRPEVSGPEEAPRLPSPAAPRPMKQ